MLDSFITLENICDVAEFLITVDSYAIKPEILEDYDSKNYKEYVVELKIALDKIKAPVKDEHQSDYSSRVNFDENLKELVNATRNLYEILTDVGKETLKKFVTIQQNKRNKEKENEKNEVKN